MLAFNHLGQLGRLGNQMFQYASLRGIARNRGYDFCIPNHDAVLSDPYGFTVKIELFYPFEMVHVGKQNIKILDRGYAPVVQEKYFHYDQILHNMCPDEISLAGFFQSEKYFKNVEDIIRQDFKFKEDIRQPCEEMMSQLDGQVVGLHIRRGDYLTNPNHCALDLSYYEQALKRFPDDATVIVFSDDSEWCHKQSLFDDDRFMISENDDGYVDQCLMSMCSDFIIANSSFSWWAAWLGNRGKVIAPKKWFPTDDKDTSDVYCEGWEVI